MYIVRISSGGRSHQISFSCKWGNHYHLLGLRPKTVQAIRQRPSVFSTYTDMTGPIWKSHSKNTLVWLLSPYPNTVTLTEDEASMCDSVFAIHSLDMTWVSHGCM